MKKIKIFVLAVLSALFLSTSAYAADAGDAKKLTIILTNTTHKSAGFGLAVANAMQEAGIPSTVFLAADALELASKKGFQPKYGNANATARELISGLIKKGGHVYVCTGCAKSQEITEDDMVKGVKIVGPAELVGGIYGEGAKVLTF